MRQRLEPSREAARLLPIALAVLLALSGCRGKSAAPGAPDTPAAPAASASLDYPIHPVPFTHVKLEDAFWAPRLETNRTVSVPYALRMNEETGRVDNFRKAAKLMAGAYRGKRYNDSDVYKSMEAAAYTLRLHPDPALDRTLDDLIAVIAKAQEPDGYLYHDPDRRPRPSGPGSGPERWSNLRVSHELYNVGHMYEAAVAHFQATGKRTFLAIAEKNAALLLRTFGAGPGQRRGFPGHQEIEIGLAKLYRVTGNRAYLDLAKFFLDERGHYFGGEKHAPDDPFAVYDSDEYMQNHKPVLEQDEAVGHAVRAMYMYSGMADVAALGGYPEYVAAIDRLWLDVAGKKQYLTGGVGRPERLGGLRRRLRAAQRRGLHGNVRGHRQRPLELPPLPPPRRIEVHGRLRARPLQRPALRRFPQRRPLLLPESPRIGRRLRTQPLVRGRLLSAEHDPLPAVAARATSTRRRTTSSSSISTSPGRARSRSPAAPSS